MPPPQYPYPYPPQVVYLAAPPTNTYAILALIFAFVMFPPLGIYFGYKARKQIAESGERGSEMATVGIVAGWIHSALLGVGLVIWCGMFGLFFVVPLLAGR
ncbi:DUF4190 domain-containing protein [Dactylosporangium sp. CA-139066]|uniref:DUF4190 domain-containing protein n=1 Tax=Dactylosporangium sp. CA-139066 TaxID=3239930 RepID=UPI003D90AC0A